MIPITVAAVLATGLLIIAICAVFGNREVVWSAMVIIGIAELLVGGFLLQEAPRISPGQFQPTPYAPLGLGFLMMVAAIAHFANHRDPVTTD